MLHVAVKMENPDVTKLLLASGANLAITDMSEETPVFPAARQGHLEQLRLLVRAGASLTSSNKVGLQPTDRT